MFLHVIIFWLGCGSEKDSSDWSSIDDCRTLSDPQNKDDCISKFIVGVFKTDPERGIELVENQISEQINRDYIYLTLTREYNPATREYCDRIQDPSLKDNCNTLQSRPHLHRDILKKKKSLP